MDMKKNGKLRNIKPVNLLSADDMISQHSVARTSNHVML